jgi:hypothetical protein
MKADKWIGCGRIFDYCKRINSEIFRIINGIHNIIEINKNI